MFSTSALRVIALCWILLLPGSVVSYVKTTIGPVDLGALAVLIVMAVIGLIWYPLRGMLYRNAHPAEPALP